MKMFRVVVNGSEYKVGIEELEEESGIPPDQTGSSAPAPAPRPAPSKAQPAGTVPQQPSASHSKKDVIDGTVTAPMPGTVISVAVADGDNVTKGQTLLILEAMKMENNIMATCDGTVQEVKTSQGASVNAGDILVVMAS